MSDPHLDLHPGEPDAGPWTTVAVDDLAEHLLEVARARRRVTVQADDPGASGAPLVIALDGRGGAGKTTVTDLLAAALARAGLRAVIVHADDLAWWEPLFGWAHLERDLLRGVRRAGGGSEVRLRPPAWRERGRAGSIDVPAGTDVVLIEGTAAAQREVGDLLDAVVWVQSDRAEAERRGIARDVADGVNGDAEEAARFWHEWQRSEVPFFEADRPWERADLVVLGTPGVLGPRPSPGDLVVAPAGVAAP